jgi:hypothetical protein
MDAVSWATIHPAEAGLMAQTIGVLDIDIAKQVFHVVGMDDSGHVVLRKRIARSELLTFMANDHRSASEWKPVEVPMTGLGVFASMATTCG